jgi:hypothetical protein
MTYSTEMRGKMYEYRKKNIDLYHLYQRNYQFQNYEKYKEKALIKKKANYMVKKEFKAFLDILLD